MKTPLQGKKNGVQLRKNSQLNRLGRGRGRGRVCGRGRDAAGHAKKSLFPQDFFCHLGRDAGSITRPWLCLTFGLPAAPRATFILARVTKMALY